MAEAAIFSVQAFQPYNGGEGARMSVTPTNSRILIPGMQGGAAQPNMRVLVTNGGLYPALVRLGGATVSAATGNLEILPGCAYLLTPPNVEPQNLYLAAISTSGVTTISACAGVGT